MLIQPAVARQNGVRGTVTLWDMLVLMNFSSCIGGSIAATTDGHAQLSVLRVLIVIPFGMLIGAGFAWLHWRAGIYASRNVAAAKLPWLYLAACFWLIAAAILSFQITRFATRLVI